LFPIKSIQARKNGTSTACDCNTIRHQLHCFDVMFLSGFCKRSGSHS
jgi:hypothetical protein